MHAIGKIVLKRRELFSRSQWLTYLIDMQSYHSENSVYGYKPNQQRHFEGIYPNNFFNKRLFIVQYVSIVSFLIIFATILKQDNIK
jgi:hypothetical protein